MANSYVVTS